jgi:hypothetical protein
MRRRRTAKWVVHGVVTMAALAFVFAGIHVVDAKTPPTWSVITPVSKLPEGNPFLLSVFGPPDAAFSLNLTEAPFNESYPLLYQVFTLPALALNNTGVSVTNLSIPTSDYSQGVVFQAKVLSMGSGASFEWDSIIRIVSSVNDTALLASFATLKENVTALGYELQSSIRQQGVQQNEQVVFFITAIVLFIVEIFAIIFTQTAVADWRIGKKIRNVFHKALWRPDYEGSDDGYHTPVTEDSQPDANRIYRTEHLFPWCRSCAFDKTIAECASHLRRTHDFRYEPVVGHDIVAHIPSLKRAVNQSKAKRPSPKEVHRRVDALDMTALKALATKYETKE